MFYRLLRIFIALLLAGSLLAACGTGPQTSLGTEVPTDVSLTDQVGGGAPGSVQSEHGQPPQGIAPLETLLPGQEGGGGPGITSGQTLTSQDAASSQEFLPEQEGGGAPQPGGNITPPFGKADCPVTPFSSEQPPAAQVGSFQVQGWYKNGDGTIWAGSLSPESPKAGINQFIWLLPQESQLQISGQREDMMASPMGVELQPGGANGSQQSSLTFPSDGCWLINASAGSSSLQFYVYVQP